MTKPANSQRPGLEFGDPGKLLEMFDGIKELDSSAFIETKMNDYLKSQTGAESTFIAVVTPDCSNAIVQTVGSEILSKKRKLSLEGDFFSSGCNTMSPYTIYTETLDANIKEIVKMGLPVKGDKSVKDKILAVPIIGSASSKISLLACLINVPDKNESMAVLITKEMFRYTLTILLNMIAYELEVDLKCKCQTILYLVHRMLTQASDLPTLLHQVSSDACRFIGAESCSVLLIDAERDEFFERNLNVTIENNKELITSRDEKRFPLNAGITGRVLVDGSLINVHNAQDHSQFDYRIDQRPNMETRSFLCFPIREAQGIIGVVQLFNKVGELLFTSSDEEMATALGLYSGICIMHALLYKNMQEEHIRYRITNELLLYHMKVNDRDVKRAVSCHREHPTTHFCDIHFNSRLISKREQPCYVMKMFEDLGFIQTFKIRRDKLARFILYVQKGYREVPYHNWTHALATAHFAYSAMIACRLQDDHVLSPLQSLAYLISTLIHDLDHRGMSNSFQIEGGTLLAALYSSEGSVMERHHLSQGMAILNSSGANILSHLSTNDYDRIVLYIRDNVIATDLANHFKLRQDLEIMCDFGIEQGNEYHISQLQSLLMTAADLADLVKDWTCVKHSAAAVIAEFFSQGDEEKKRGLTPAPIMDRELAFIPDLEIDFIEKIGIPVFVLLEKLFPQMSSCAVIMRNHTVRWRAAATVFHQATSQDHLEILLGENFDEDIETVMNQQKEDNQ